MKHDCNDCENSLCKGDRMTVANNVVRVLPCRGFKKPQPMKTPLLMVALAQKNGGTVINQILRNFEMKFSETDHYPWFRLEI